MTEQVPSKELGALLTCAKEPSLTNAAFTWAHIKLMADEIDRLQRELADRPALLDGLSIQQWKAHAKAGWKMYAARAENEPCAECAEKEAELERRQAKIMRTAQPRALLRQISALAYDTSKSADDRIREIQALWEGATPPPDPDLIRRIDDWFAAYMHDRHNHDEAAWILARIRELRATSTKGAEHG